MRRTKEEAEATRDSLLKAGLTVFSRKGYQATTLEDIAREAGVTRGAVYWHFGSKAGLYNTMLATYSARSAQIVQDAAARGGSLPQILHRVFAGLLEAVENDDELRSVMEISLFKTERTGEMAASEAQQLDSLRGLLAGITEVMHRGAASGELRSDVDPSELARAFLSLQQGVSYLWLLDPGAFSLKDSAEPLARVMLNGIALGQPTEGETGRNPEEIENRESGGIR